MADKHARRKTLAVDFDGVVAYRPKEARGNEPPTALMPGAKEALEELASRYRLILFTCRCNFEGGRETVEEFLRTHELEHLFAEVTNVKPVAMYYLDDHGVRFHSWSNAIDTIRYLESQGL